MRVTRSLTIPDDEIQLTFSPSGGPGGQHANKASTRAELAWNPTTSRALGPIQRQRLETNLRSRLDSSGALRLRSGAHRSQLRNRQEVESRLAALVRDALAPIKTRTPTDPTRASKRRRMQAKRRRSETKKLRRAPSSDPS